MMIEILKEVESFVNSQLFVNLLATVFAVYGIYNSIKSKLSKYDNNNLRTENTQLTKEMNDFKNITQKEIETLKEMFLLAFNNSKLGSDVKLKLNDIAKGKGFLNIKNDIIKPIQDSIKSTNVSEKEIKSDLIDKLVSKIDDNKEV